MIKKILPILVLVFVGNLIASAQASVGGKVVDVPDARTLVIETTAGPLTAQLQYIEVPESAEPLFAETKDHLAKLVAGKYVEIKVVRIVRGRSIGRVALQGVDLSLQMIRDGAAWHEPKETSGQAPNEAADYDGNQTLAKSEKRGVWSGAILKTPWEVRAEKDERQRALEVARRISHPTLVGVGQFQSDIRRPLGQNGPTRAATVDAPRMQMDAWVNVFARANKEPYGLLTYSDPKGRFTGVYTSASLIDFDSPAGKERLECRTMLVAPTLNTGSRGKFYLIGFRAISSDYRFSIAKTRLTVMVDKHAMALGAPFGLRGRGLIGAEEIMYYRVSWAQLKKIGNANKVEFRINKLTGALPDESRALIKQLAEATG